MILCVSGVSCDTKVLIKYEYTNIINGTFLHGCCGTRYHTENETKTFTL